MVTLGLIVVLGLGVIFMAYGILDTWFNPPTNDDDKDDAPWNQ